MYKLMKSEQIRAVDGAGGLRRAYEQMEVRRYPVLDEAVAACNEANRELEARYYVLDDCGREYYATRWID